MRKLNILAFAALTIVLILSLSHTPPQPEVRLVEVIKPLYIQPEQSPISAMPLGEFEVTYYTAGRESTGKTLKHPAYGLTKSGATVREGVTVAVDPNVIPLGSYLYIEGIGFRVAQDTGGAIKGNALDVYVPDVSDALERGRHPAKVYLISRGGS